MLFTASVVVVKAVTLIPERGDAVAAALQEEVHFTWKSLQACGNFVFAFGVGSNIPAIACEMEAPTLGRCMAASAIGNGLMLVFYATLSFTCYFSFVGVTDVNVDGHGTNSTGVLPDFLSSYPRKDPWITAARGMLSITLLSVATIVTTAIYGCF